MIRRYHEHDTEQLLDVWYRASKLAHPFLSEDFLEVERGLIRDRYLPKSETWIWEAKGRVAAFISLLGNEVGGLFVDPEHHRSGIGRSLIEHATGLHGGLEVEVFEQNSLGRRFYSAVGFKEVGRGLEEDTGLAIIRMAMPGKRD